jgi:acetyltransferase
MNDPLRTFFHPRGVAVIGASSNPQKLSHGVLKNLIEHGYTGAIYPVNPKGGEILGLTVYPSVADVPDPVDLAVIVISANLALGALEACGRRGIDAAVVVAGGFGELGTEGEEREADLRAVAEEYDMRVIGPNCVGVMDTYAPIDTTFIRTMPDPGGIGFVSHSGAVCGATLDWADTVDVGFSRIISLGNQADVDVADSLDSLAADPHTRVVVAYIEGLPDGRRFVEAARRLTEEKPLVVLKAGRTPSGTRAVASHTGALAGADRAFQAACRRAGALSVDTLEELTDAAVALAYRNPPAGPRIALLTNAGGPVAVGADTLDRCGLQLANLSAETQAQLQQVCPPGTMLGNPVDMLGGAGPTHYVEALRVLLAAPEVDGVMALYVPQAITPPEEVAKAMAQGAADASKPVMGCISGGNFQPSARILHEAQIPHYTDPSRAAEGLGMLWRYGQRAARRTPAPTRLEDVERERAARLIEEAMAQGQDVLDAQLGAQLAAAYGLTVPSSGLASTAEAAVTLAEEAGYPVALKRVAPGVVHKSDVGGVALNLADEAALRAAFEDVVEAGEQAFIQRMAPAGREVIVGAQRDAQFGPLVMFGLGGVYVEVLRDVAFRLAPLSAEEAREMVAETAAGKLLAGVRGQTPGDVEAVVETLRRVGQLMADHPGIAEIDLNPLIVGAEGTGAWAVDVRVILADPE